MNLKKVFSTTRDQSRRLMDIGLDRDTADMYFDLTYSCQTPFVGDYPGKGFEMCNPNIIEPAWSLYRLIDMFPCLVSKKSCSVLLGVHKRGISCIYTDLKGNDSEEIDFDAYEDLYDNFIEAFEWAIDKGLVNEEYLDR